MFDSSFFFHLFPIMFRYIDVTLGISLAALLLALLIAVVIAAAYYLNIPGLKQVCAAGRKRLSRTNAYSAFIRKQRRSC